MRQRLVTIAVLASSLCLAGGAVAAASTVSSHPAPQVVIPASASATSDDHGDGNGDRNGNGNNSADNSGDGMMISPAPRASSAGSDDPAGHDASEDPAGRSAS